MSSASKTVYLTFDDGPVPVYTEFVLEQLQRHGAKATFFCIGENVGKHPDIFKKVLEAGHTVGNHSQHHLNGWKTPDQNYVLDVKKARSLINSDLFRPPYGRIKKSQSRQLTGEFRIVMWDVLSYDFDANTSPEQCLRNVTQHTRPGSIVVFHDSEKAFPNLKYALPKYLDYLSAEGYTFAAITGQMIND